MPFLQLAIIQTAVSHLSRPIGESSKMVPTLTENCLWGCLALHSHRRRVLRNRTSLLPQVGQETPSGQRRAAMKVRQGSESEKKRTGCKRVVGCCIFPPVGKAKPKR